MTVRAGVYLLAVGLGVAAAAPRPALADWPPEGRLLCSACLAGPPAVVVDLAGGAFVCWGDYRNGLSGSNFDLFLQRITASGEISPGWPADGLPVCTDPSTLHLSEQPVVPDGLGGVFLVWTDYRDVVVGGTSVDVYVQRVLADGSLAPGWIPNGVAATRANGHQFAAAAVSDGAGGVYVTWDDITSFDIYLQHLTATGQVAPGWPPNGLPVCIDPGEQRAPRLAADAAGGVFIVWGDLRDGPIDAYVQRVTAGGQLAPGWPENGRRIAANRARRQIMPDGEGGAYLSAATLGGSADDDYHLIRFTGDGTLAPGWPEGGVPVCLAPDERQGIRMVPDGVDGVLLTWADERDFGDDDVFALRIRSDGSRHPGWPVDGLRITDNSAIFDDEQDLAGDGMGGAYLGWSRYPGPPGIEDGAVVVHHLRGDGTLAPGWPADGLALPTLWASRRPRMVEDGAGGAIVAWEDVTAHVRALRIGVDGPVPVLLSLVSAEAEPGRVRLVWQAPEGAPLRAAVERRTDASDWEPQGAVIADGTGALRHEDRAVTAGTRYGYRLAYAEGDGTGFTSETWVTVPALAFALQGLTPNPSAGDPVVAFSLAAAAPAALELFDLHGRRVESREVGALGPGVHSVRFGARGRLAAGVYLIRLRQGAQTATTRAVILR